MNARRWELDPASAEDYDERVRHERAGERFRQWLMERVTSRPDGVSMRRTALRSIARLDS